MHLLIIGGKQFVGKHLVQSALDHGHKVTLFNRGKTNPELFPEVENIIGDRAKDISALEGRKFDIAIDTCGYFPEDVEKSAELLKDVVDRYVFISTISVYKPEDKANMTEDEELREPIEKSDGSGQITKDTYGPMKVQCEKIIQDIYGDRYLIIRPGLIVGPDDPTDRFTYYVKRVGEGGEILTPDSDQAFQIIDVRDLAEFTIDMIEKNQTAITHATGPERKMTVKEIFELCRSTLNSEANLVMVDPEFLSDKFDEENSIPLYFGHGQPDGIFDVDISKALAEGLKLRPLEETIRDTLTFIKSQGTDYQLRFGLKPGFETDLLNRWHNR